jgi:isoleucyl-tRNA synthetase
MKAIAAALKSGSFSQPPDSAGVVDESRLRLEVEGEVVYLSEAADEYSQSLVPVAEEGGSLASASIQGLRSVVLLETAVTPELEREGLARDLVRVIQQARKDAGLDVSDRIRLRVDGDAALAAAVEEHGAFIRAQTLTSELELAHPEPGMATAEGEVGDTKARIGLARIG